MLCQLATNGVVEGANRDFLRAYNPEHIAAAKSNVVKIMKAGIFLDSANGHKYKQLKNDLENDFYKCKDNYPPTTERAVHLLNTYKLKFEYTKKGVNLVSDEEEVAFIERG